MVRLRLSLVLVDKITTQYAIATHYYSLAYAPICSTRGVLIALPLDGTSSRHIKIHFVNRTSSGRRYDSQNTRWMRSLREHGVTRAHPRGFERLYKMPEIDRERTDITIQNSDTRPIGTRLHEMTRLWLRRTRKVTLPKILQRVVAEDDTLRHKYLKTRHTTISRAFRT